MVDKLHNCVVQHTKRIADAFEYLWKYPETGYKEWKSRKYLADAFRELGYSLHEAGNIPGFYTDVDTGRPGLTVAVCCQGKADPRWAYLYSSLKEAYLTYVDSFTADIDAVQYREDGSVVLLPKAGTIDCN